MRWHLDSLRVSVERELDRHRPSPLARRQAEPSARAVVEAVEPEADAFVSADYRARAAGICAARALSAAAERARGERS